MFVSSSIFEAGGKGYTVQIKPKDSFEYAKKYFDTYVEGFGK